MKQHAPQVFAPSRLFIYYNERVMEGTVNSDSGAQIRDGIKSVGQARRLPRTGMAVRHRQVPHQAVRQVLQRRHQTQGGAANG